MQKYLMTFLLFNVAVLHAAQEAATPTNTPLQLIRVIVPTEDAAQQSNMSLPGIKNQISAATGTHRRSQQPAGLEEIDFSDQNQQDAEKASGGLGVIDEEPQTEQTIDAQLLALYPSLAQDKSALAFVQKNFKANTTLAAHLKQAQQKPVQDGAKRKVNFMKLHASPPTQPRTQQQQTGASDESTDSETLIAEEEKRPEPTNNASQMVGTALIGMLMAHNTASSQKQKKTTYLTAAGGAVATALCGLLVKYINGQC